MTSLDTHVCNVPAPHTPQSLMWPQLLSFKASSKTLQAKELWPHMTSHEVTRAVNIKSVLFSLWGDYFSTCSSFVIEPFPGQRGSGYESDPASLRPAESSWLTTLVSLLNPFVHTTTQRKCQHWHTYAVTSRLLVTKGTPFQFHICS